MSHPGKGLQDIPVRAETPAPYSVGNIKAILNEIATHLEKFATSGTTGLIDLKSLPFAPTEYEQLRLVLGRGEVTARLDAIGDSEIYETHFPGVWWVTHYNVEGDIVADLIEIAAFPGILCSHPEDVSIGLARLRHIILQPASPGD